MNQIQKTLLCVVTVLPALYLIAFLAFFPFLLEIDGVTFSTLFKLHSFTIFLEILLMIFYVRDVLNNKKIPETRKTLWVLLVIFGNAITMPIYFYTFILKRRG